MTTIQKKAVGVSTGKIILIGEHSAVYSKPAIAIPCTAVTATTTVYPAEKDIFIDCTLYQGPINNVPPLLIGVKTIIIETLKQLNAHNTPLHLTIESTIPLERGMGSSAAISISIIKALFQYFGKTPTQHELLTLSELSEKIVHGNPSGLDAATIVSQEAVLFQKGQPITPFPFHIGAYLVIADSGITGQTKTAVEQVANLQKQDAKLHEQLINQLGELTLQAKQALQNKNRRALGDIFNHAHQLLKQLGVSHPILDTLTHTALQHGAIGAKLTGGGLGGCMIALTDTLDSAENIANALLKSDAKQTYIQSI